MKICKPHIMRAHGGWCIFWMDWAPDPVSFKPEWVEHQTMSHTTVKQAWGNYLGWLR